MIGEITFDLEKMKATRMDAIEFLDSSYESTINNQQYCYLFLNPPHGSHYSVKDFETINHLLFPKGFYHLEVFDWSSDWSNYFQDGLEWWGAKCFSIYDKDMNRFVVIGASATD